MTSTVTTTDVSTAVLVPLQRKGGFYASGRFWVFYYYGGYIRFKSTTDPADWSAAATSMRQTDDGERCSIWFNGTYVYYACYYNYDLFYRRGIPESNGTITWSAAEQTVYDGTSTDFYCEFPCISVDSNGYAWIGGIHCDGTYRYPRVLKNANNNGTWSTEFAYEFSSTSASWYVIPVPLTGGKVYVIYCRGSNAPTCGKLYDSGWGSEETDLADYNSKFFDTICATAEGDNVHFTYSRTTTYQLRYNKRTYGVGWGANDVLIQDAVQSGCYPALSVDTASGNLYCFWLRTDTKHVYYKKCVSGTWDTDPTDWIDESVDGIKYTSGLSSYSQAYNNYIGLLYETKTAALYNVKFAYLTIAGGVTYEVGVSETSISVFDSPTYNMRKAVAVSESLGTPSDAASRLLSAFRTVSEASISASDSVAKATTRVLSASEALGSPSDSTAYSLRRTVSIGEPSISMSDSLAYTLHRDKAVSESAIAVSDAVLSVFWGFRTVSEPSISVSDAVTCGLFRSITVSEVSITFSDSTVQLLYRVKAISESSISASDGTTAEKVTAGLERSVTEPVISVSDDAVRVLWAYRTVSEPSITVLDAVWAGIFGKVKATKLFLIIGDLAIQLTSD